MVMPSSRKRDLVIVLVTCVLTGIVSPLVVNSFQNFALRQQREHEAIVARQASVIQAQERLLDTLSQQILEFEFLALKISFYKQQNAKKQFETAVNKYDEESWNYFQAITAEVYKSGRLVDARQYPSLEKFTALQSAIDEKLNALTRSDANADEWSTFDRCLRLAMGVQTPRMLEDLARDLKLTGSGLRNVEGGKTPSPSVGGLIGPPSVIAGSVVVSEPFDFRSCMASGSRLTR
jgi:hypothetical protein